jgi:hypothetical protein
LKVAANMTAAIEANAKGANPTALQTVIAMARSDSHVTPVMVSSNGPMSLATAADVMPSERVATLLSSLQAPTLASGASVPYLAINRGGKRPHVGDEGERKSFTSQLATQLQKLQNDSSIQRLLTGDDINVAPIAVRTHSHLIVSDDDDDDVIAIDPTEMKRSNVNHIPKKAKVEGVKVDVKVETSSSSSLSSSSLSSLSSLSSSSSSSSSSRPSMEIQVCRLMKWLQSALTFTRPPRDIIQKITTACSNQDAYTVFEWYQYVAYWYQSCGWNFIP